MGHAHVFFISDESVVFGGITELRNTKNFIPSSTGKNLEFLKLPDCVHLTEYCRCEIMKVPECIGMKCSACQSAAEKLRSGDIWRRRMNSLSDEQQTKIASVYYSGKKPWKEAK